MNKKAMIRRLQCEVVTTRLNLRTQTKRTDELAARVADLEVQGEGLGEMIMEQASWINGLTTRVAALESELAEPSDASGIKARTSTPAQEWRHRQEGEGVWWYEDGENASYTVTVTER
jgi:hypothetical protein